MWSRRPAFAVHTANHIINPFICQVLNLKVTESLSYGSHGLGKKHPDESGQVVFGSGATVAGTDCQTLACGLDIMAL